MAEDCRPLASELECLCFDVRDELRAELMSLQEVGEGPRRRKQLEALLTEFDEDEPSAWLTLLSKSQLKPVLRGVREWLKDEPDWAQEDDDIPQQETPQGAALEFFQDMDSEDRKALGVVIVEGDHPGSTYYAAELRVDIETGNRVAEERGLDCWFAKPTPPKKRGEPRSRNPSRPSPEEEDENTKRIKALYAKAAGSLRLLPEELLGDCWADRKERSKGD